MNASRLSQGAVGSLLTIKLWAAAPLGLSEAIDLCIEALPRTGCRHPKQLWPRAGPINVSLCRVPLKRKGSNANADLITCYNCYNSECWGLGGLDCCTWWVEGSCWERQCCILNRCENWLFWKSLVQCTPLMSWGLAQVRCLTVARMLLRSRIKTLAATQPVSVSVSALARLFRLGDLPQGLREVVPQSKTAHLFERLVRCLRCI